jgi:hypothetical protein
MMDLASELLVLRVVCMPQLLVEGRKPRGGSPKPLMLDV